MEETPLIKLKEEKMDSFETEAHTLSSAVEAAARSHDRAAECSSPPSSSLPFMSVAVKQEPLSPVHISSEPDPANTLSSCAHSTTPELPVAPARASSPGSVACCLSQTIKDLDSRSNEAIGPYLFYSSLMFLVV